MSDQDTFPTVLVKWKYKDYPPKESPLLRFVEKYENVKAEILGSVFGKYLRANWVHAGWTSTLRFGGNGPNASP